MSIAAILIAVAFGRAHPAAQICQETRTLRDAAGILPAEPLRKLQTKRLEALLENGAPACAVKQLAQPDYRKVKQKHDVPANVTGIGAVRARLTNLGLDVTDLVLIGIAVLLVLRTGLAFVISRRPGVVNLGTVTNASDKTNPADHAIAAQIQQRLAEQHLYGVALVPGGGLPEAVATTLKDTDLPNAKSLSALVGLIPKLLPKSGVTVDAVVRTNTKAPTHGCTITLTDLSSGRVIDTFTQWRTNAVDSADAAAMCAITHILDRDPVRRRTPNWSRFGQRSREALEALVKGDNCIAGIDGNDAAAKGYEAAIAEYEAALRHDPSNLSVAMKLGGAQEVLAGKRVTPDAKAKQMLKAAQTYLRASALWSYAYAPRYRAAIALAACAEHIGPIQSELQTLHLSDVKDCRDAADELLAGLVADLRWCHVLWRWLETFLVKREREAGTRRYFRRFVNPLSRERIQMRTTYQMAKPVVCDRDADKEVDALLHEAFPPDHPLRAWLGVNWQVRYNAACYYSRRAKAVKTKKQEDALLARANELLTEVLRDPRQEVTGAWLDRDPDLYLLRNWPGSGWRKKEINVIGELDS